jgi:hypothetical protein
MYRIIVWTWQWIVVKEGIDGISWVITAGFLAVSWSGGRRGSGGVGRMCA